MVKYPMEKITGMKIETRGLQPKLHDLLSQVEMAQKML